MQGKLAQQAHHVEHVVAEKARRHKLAVNNTAQAEVASGIEAFEVALTQSSIAHAPAAPRPGSPNVKPGASGSGAGAHGRSAHHPPAGGFSEEGCGSGSAADTLRVLRARAPSPEALAEASSEYLAHLQARQRQAAAAQQEREVRHYSMGQQGRWHA
jgi:hypothetical protein